MPERAALINDATSRQVRLSTPLCANGAESQPRPASVELLADQPLVQAVTGIEQDAVTHLRLRPDLVLRTQVEIIQFSCQRHSLRLEVTSPLASGLVRNVRLDLAGAAVCPAPHGP